MPPSTKPHKATFQNGNSFEIFNHVDVFTGAVITERQQVFLSIATWIIVTVMMNGVRLMLLTEPTRETQQYTL